MIICFISALRIGINCDVRAAVFERRKLFCHDFVVKDLARGVAARCVAQKLYVAVAEDRFFCEYCNAMSVKTHVSSGAPAVESR